MSPLGPCHFSLFCAFVGQTLLPNTSKLSQKQLPHDKPGGLWTQWGPSWLYGYMTGTCRAVACSAGLSPALTRKQNKSSESIH